MDPGNEDDVLESTCIDVEVAEARTYARLRMQPAQKQPVAFWSQRYYSTKLSHRHF